jgi:MFS family permease
MQNVDNTPIAPNAKRLLWAGFFAILAAGVGAAIRGGILDNWGSEFGFTGTQLGAITGAGFTGFCFGIIIGGVVCDKIGYGKLVIAAFALHILSAVVTFTAKGDSAYQSLYWGMFIFAYANGTLEAVANPLVATLFPNNRTHFLNILHASWPAGLVIGSALGWLLDDRMHLSWQIQLSLYLIPTIGYGIMFFGQHMPKSEASAKGLSLGEMFKDVGMLGALIVCFLLALFLSGVLEPLFASKAAAPDAAAKTAKMVGYGIGGALLIAVGIMTRFSLGSFLLFILFITHALVGAVELGTDGWIQNITGNLFTSEQGKYLFMWTSAIMFSLRFCANFIEKRLGLSPVGILLSCSLLACVGLLLASNITTITVAFLALAVYAIGKTFFWPTMLAVASDRFPRTGAIAISIMGGIGMMSAGLIGSPGLGYAKDRFAGEALRQTNPAAFEAYKAAEPKGFLFFDKVNGFDGTKLGAAQAAPAAQRTPEQQAVVASSIAGDRKTLKADSFIPATMAVIYLVLLIYFKAIGGYKPVHLAGTQQTKTSLDAGMKPV